MNKSEHPISQPKCNSLITNRTFTNAQSEQKKDTNRVMSFPDDKNVLFLGIVVPHREHINSNDILVYGIN